MTDKLGPSSFAQNSVVRTARGKSFRQGGKKGGKELRLSILKQIRWAKGGISLPVKSFRASSKAAEKKEREKGSDGRICQGRENHAC